MNAENKEKQIGPATDFEVVKRDNKAMEFVPYGAQDRIKLSVSIIQNTVAVPTRSGKTCSERDALKFMMMCQAQRLNPFAGDAYLVGYDSQEGPSFSLITAHQAFLKRAEMHPQYDGMESGIVLLKEDGTTEDRETDFHLPEERVVGGWARVHVKDRKIATYRRVRMERFNKGRAQWKEDAAGMICKCAEADALRSSFPTMVGGLYLREEMDFMPNTNGNGFQVPERAGNLVAVISDKPAEPAPVQSSPEGDGTNKEPERAGEAKPTPQAELESVLTANGISFAEFIAWGDRTGAVPDAGSLPDMAALPADVAKRLLKGKLPMINGIKKAKAEAAQ